MENNCDDRLTLRPYEPSDAETIITWITDESTLRSWSADRYDHFPITADNINAHYDDLSAERGDVHPLTAVIGQSIAGHMVLAPAQYEPGAIRFMYVIVDDKRRGTGVGRRMLSLAVRYAFDELNAMKITLGVFENNPAAYRCYSSVGFRDLGDNKAHYVHLMGEDRKCFEMELTKERIKHEHTG